MAFRAITSDVTTTSVATSNGTMPAVQAGDRVWAFVGTAAANPTTVADPAGWTFRGSYAPSGFMHSRVYSRTIASSDESGGVHTWTWSAASRTWAVLVAHSGTDVSRAPLFNAIQGVPDSAGPSPAPTLVLPSQDWLMTLAVGRESPGTDNPKSWSISPADVERADVYGNNAGTGQKLVVAAFDSGGPVTSSNTGGGSTGGSVGAQAPPTNTYNKIVTSSRTMRVGCTVKKDELAYWTPKLAGLDWMRIFPDSDGLPPDWTDPRFGFCKQFDAEPFISSKVDGDTAKLSTLSAYLKAMPSWVLNHPDPDFYVWITDRHEPEGDVTPTVYKANSNKLFDMIEALPSNILARIQYGHVQTRQWTENTSGRSYATHDTGRGTFWGVDAYGNSWSASNASSITTAFVSPVTFLSDIKAYNAGSRKKILPEVGYIGATFDTDGTARAAWLQGIHDEMASWGNGGGYIWWNTEGKSGTSLTGAGTKRWFQFDRRHTGTDGSYAIIPSVAPSSSGGGSSATGRQVSTSVPVSSSHIVSVSVPMPAEAPPVDPATVNAWSHLGLPQR